jgi:calcineurin-like phosphoesterase family protein
MLEWFPETRPFSNLSQMHEYMIESHNARVTNSTDVYFLGDFAYGRKIDEKELRKIFEKLKGRKHLITGNHDNRAVLDLRWSSAPRSEATVSDGEHRIYLNHYAVRSWPGFYNGHLHFYGHTHGKLPSQGRSIDVGVDCWHMAPTTASEAVARMKLWNPDFDSYRPERKRVILCAEDNVPEDEAYTPELRNAPGYGGYRP